MTSELGKRFKHSMKKRWALYSPLGAGLLMFVLLFLATNPEIAEAGRHN